MIRIFAGVLAVFAVFLGVLAWGYEATISYDALGPRPFPLVVCGLLACCALFLCIRGDRVSVSAPPHLDPKISKKIFLCSVVLLGYAMIFDSAGFFVATVAMSVIVGAIFGGRGKFLIFSAIFLSVCGILIFDYALEVTLPRGIFRI